MFYVILRDLRALVVNSFRFNNNSVLNIRAIKKENIAWHS